MGKIKQGIFIFFFFGLLVCIAAAPTFVTHYYNGRLLNTVTLRELPEEETLKPMGIWEKLEIVRRAKERGTFFIDGYADEREEAVLEQVRAALEGELVQLLEPMGIDLDVMRVAYSTKMIYVDRDRINAPVSIWNAYVWLPKYGIDVYFDAETGKIYDISLYLTEDGLFSKQAPEHLRQLGEEYLELDAEEVPEGAWLGIEVDYDDTLLWMHLYGYDTSGEYTTIYGFMEDWTDASAGRKIYSVQMVNAAEY